MCYDFYLAVHIHSRLCVASKFMFFFLDFVCTQHVGTWIKRDANAKKKIQDEFIQRIQISFLKRLRSLHNRKKFK